MHLGSGDKQPIQEELMLYCTSQGGEKDLHCGRKQRPAPKVSPNEANSKGMDPLGRNWVQILPSAKILLAKKRKKVQYPSDQATPHRLRKNKNPRRGEAAPQLCPVGTADQAKPNPGRGSTAGPNGLKGQAAFIHTGLHTGLKRLGKIGSNSALAGVLSS